MVKLARPSRASTPSPECFPGNWRIAAGGWQPSRGIPRGGKGRNGAGKGRGKGKERDGKRMKSKERKGNAATSGQRYPEIQGGNTPGSHGFDYGRPYVAVFPFWPRRGSAMGARIFLRHPIMGCRKRTPCAEFRIEFPSPIREAALRLPIGYVMDAESTHKDRDVYSTRWE